MTAHNVVTRKLGDKTLAWLEVRYYIPLPEGNDADQYLAVFEDMARDKGFEIVRELPADVEYEEFEPGRWSVSLVWSATQPDTYEAVVREHELAGGLIRPLRVTKRPPAVVFNTGTVEWQSSGSWWAYAAIVYRDGKEVCQVGPAALWLQRKRDGGPGVIRLESAKFMINFS